MSRSLAVLAILLGIAAQSLPTAVEEFSSINKQAQAAHQSSDTRAYLASALRMQGLLHHSPASVRSVAKAYAAAGDLPHALSSLQEFAAMGQSDDSLAGAAAFSALQNHPEYKTILEHLTRNKAPVSKAATAFLLSDPGLLAEDIAYDPQSNTFLITSVLQHKIIRVTPDGKATDFAQSPSHWPVFAIKTDPPRNLAWATESATDGFAAAPKSDWGRSALLCFNLHTGALLRRIEGPPHTALGDMALAEDGTPILSDGDAGGVYRLIANRLEPLNRSDFISPQTPVIAPHGNRAFVPDYLRGIGLLDLATGHLTWLSSEKKIALNGIDGLYLAGHSLFLTQNGTSPERILRLQLDASLTRVLSEEIIEQSTPTLGDPTHGVIVGDSFYYIANSGWDALDDHGQVKPGSKLTPARIMRFHLQ